MVSVPARRQQVAYGRELGLSARRACTLFSVARSTLKYRSRKATKDAPVVERMTELSAQYPRYGYRRIRIFLDRDGHAMSPGRAHRLWRTARLQVPRKRPGRSVEQLDNPEIDALIAAVTAEAEHLDRLPPNRSKTDSMPQPRQALTTGKLNAVRAAFKAGVKPSAIARQFGISQSNIRTALAGEGGGRKSGR